MSDLQWIIDYFTLAALWEASTRVSVTTASVHRSINMSGVSLKGKKWMLLVQLASKQRKSLPQYAD